MKTPSQILRLLVLTSLMATAQTQEISIPDSGLNAAIRDALQKPAGPLTAQDLLGLTNLYASGIGVRSLEGLEAAHNLTMLNLEYNELTILSSTDLAAWNELETLTNALGAALFTDVEANNSSQKFYRATVTLP